MSEGRYLAVDVDYRDDGTARAAGIGFDDFKSDAVAAQVVAEIAKVAPYRPGRFFERELPALLALFEQVTTLPEIVVIDGYVTLGASRRAGLGMHLYEALAGRVATVGVAKSRFADTPETWAVYRGASRQALFVTAQGIDETRAREMIATMHGPHRMPTLLGAVDRLCRGRS